jgi:hypothetical protein
MVAVRIDQTIEQVPGGEACVIGERYTAFIIFARQGLTKLRQSSSSSVSSDRSISGGLGRLRPRAVCIHSAFNDSKFSWQKRALTIQYGISHLTLLI